MFTSPGAVMLNLGPLTIRWYGFIIGLALLFSYIFVMRVLKRKKMDVQPIENMAFWIVLGGVVGARLYFVMLYFSYFAQNPADIFKIWHGGLAIHGALLGGAAAYFICAFKYKINWAAYADVIIPAVLFSQALGRWGNFFNSEAFGRPTSLPWKLFIPLENRPLGYEIFEFFHPTFLYESLWNLLGFAVLIWISKKIYEARGSFFGRAGRAKPHGLVLCVYLLWYGCGRFFMEFLRLDAVDLGFFTVAQWVSLILAFAGVLGLFYLEDKRFFNFKRH